MTIFEISVLASSWVIIIFMESSVDLCFLLEFRELKIKSPSHPSLSRKIRVHKFVVRLRIKSGPTVTKKHSFYKF